MTRIDYRLNALVDASLGDTGTLTDLTDLTDLADLAAIASRNGATLIQYRDKTASTRAMIAQAIAIRQAIAGTGVPLVINDRVDVALASGADGVHLGADDMEAATARSLLGPDAIIGLTVKNATDAARAGAAPIDYACIGGVFETLSKKNPDPPVGLAGLTALRRQLRDAAPDLAVGAIAGIDLARVPAIIEAGVDGVAVISAIFRAPDIAAATRALRDAVDAGLRRRAP